MPEIEQSTRDAIRNAAADLAAALKVPDGEFPGQKGIYCANLSGYLGRFAVPLLNALEASEARVAELERL